MRRAEMTPRFPLLRHAALLALGCVFAGGLIGAGLTRMLDRPPLPASIPATNDPQHRPPRGASEIVAIVKSRRDIDGVLRAIVEHTPALAAVRFALVQEDALSIENIRVLHFSILAGIATQGHPAISLTQNLPLWQWRDFLVDIIAKPKCVVRDATDLTDTDTAERLQARGVAALIACSVFSQRGNFVGVLFADFDRLSDLPPDLGPITTRLKAAAMAIGQALAASGEETPPL